MKNLKQIISKYSFWTGLAAAVVLLVQTIASCFDKTINEDIVYNIVMAICGILVVFGVVSIPPKKSENTQTSNIETEEKSEDLEQTEEKETAKQKTKDLPTDKSK